MQQIDLSGISIIQMQIFITAGDELNYTRTANICNVTQPTVSRSIDALERTLGLSLIYKHSNRMQMTPAGKVIHSCFKEILCELYRNIQIAHERQEGIDSKLRITFPVNSNLSKPIALLGQTFTEDYSEKRVSLEYKDSSHTQGLQYLLDNRVDVMFTVDLIQEMLDRYEELDSCVIMEMPLYAYMPRMNPLSCKRKLTFSDLSNQKLIVQKREVDSHCARRLEKCFSQAGYSPTISHYCDFTMEGALNLQKDDEVLIADRFALSFMPPNISRVEINQAQMKYLMVWRKNEGKDTMVSEFIRYAEEYFKNLNFKIFE